MPAITDRSTKPSILKTARLNHGTLHCFDIARTRRFYEEVLGLEVIQTSPLSLMVRKGTDHVYAVIEARNPDLKPMGMLNHNGFEVYSPEEVDAAHAALNEIKDEWDLKIMPMRAVHGEHAFKFIDLDGNWWEIVCTRAGGYVADFEDKGEWDLTGRHDLDGWARTADTEKRLMHTHDPEVRAKVREGMAQGA